MRDDSPLKVQIGQIWVRKGSHTGILSTWRVDEEKPGVGWKCTCLTAETGSGAFTAGSRHFWAMKSASVWTLEPAAPVQEVRVGQHWQWVTGEHLVVESLSGDKKTFDYRIGNKQSPSPVPASGRTTIAALRGMARLVKDAPAAAQGVKVGQVWEWASGRVRTVDRIDHVCQMVGFVDGTTMLIPTFLESACLVLEKVAPTVPSVYVPKGMAPDPLFCPTTCNPATPCKREGCLAERHLATEMWRTVQMTTADAKLPAPPKPLTTGIQPTRYGFAFTRIDGRARR